MAWENSEDGFLESQYEDRTHLEDDWHPDDDAPTADEADEIDDESLDAANDYYHTLFSIAKDRLEADIANADTSEDLPF